MKKPWLCAAIAGFVYSAPACAEPHRDNDVTIMANSCKKRMHAGCMTARQISRYGVENYWEVLYADIDGKLTLAQDLPYGLTLDDECGKQGYSYLKTLTPAPRSQLQEVLAAAQDVKEECELARIRADGLVAVNQAIGVEAKDIADFRVFRIAKRDLPTAPQAYQDMLRPWVAE